MRGFAIFGLCFLCAVSVAGAAATTCVVEATFDPEARTLRGVEEVTVDARVDTAYFLLLANLDRERNPFLGDRTIDERYEAGFEPSSTTIERVEAVQSGSTQSLTFRLLSLPPDWQTYSLDETVLAVDLPPAQTASLVLRIAFWTDIPRLQAADQGIHRGILTWRFGWHPLLLERQGEWVERKGVLGLLSGGTLPVEFPATDYRGAITLPQGYAFACGADHVEEVPGAAPAEGAEGTTTYRVWNDAPARSLAVAAGTAYERFTLLGASVPIEVLFLPGHDEEARLFATYAVDVLADYEKRFGPYPRARLVIAEAPNEDGASMAADGIVWLSTLYFSHRNVTVPGILNRLCEFVLAHEIAHQWWGIGVGSDFNAENWLSEGLSQYLAVSYFESRHGEFGPNLFEFAEAGLLENLVRSQFGFLNLREHEVELPYLLTVAKGFDEAVIKPLSEVQYENATSVRLYDKGYLVARAIAAAVGREAFETGLREAAARYSHAVIGVDLLRGVLEEVAGRPLGDLFAAWLFEPGSADYSIEITSRERVKSGYRTVVAVGREGGAVQPVVVEATLVSGKTVRLEWDGASERGALVFATDGPVARATIDPDHLLPDRDRLNNNSPVKFVATSGTNILPLDAYVLRPDPLAQGVTLTYLDRLRLSFGQGFAAADVYQGRSHHLFGEVKLGGAELTGTVGYTFTGFARPETGAPGTFWESAFALTVSGHRLVVGEELLTYLHLGLAAYPVVESSRSTALGLDLTLAGPGRMKVSAFDEASLFPQVYLQGTVVLGTGFGALPSSLLFDLEELHSFGRLTSAGWVPQHFQGSQKLYGSLAIELPLTGDGPYNVVNLVMVDKTRGRLFVACGLVWSGFDEWQTATPNVEVGAELVFDLSAIGGLLPASAAVGFATPLVGDGAGILYFRFSL